MAEGVLALDMASISGWAYFRNRMWPAVCTACISVAPLEA